MSISNHFLGILPYSAQGRWGLVTNYDPTNHTCKIQFLPDDFTSNDLPIATMAAGTSSIRYAPIIGQMAFVQSDTGDFENGVVTGFGHNDLNRPPDALSVMDGSPVLLQPGEISIVTNSGIQMRFGAGGILYIQATDIQVTTQTGELRATDTLTVTAPTTAWKGDINLAGKLHATEDIQSDQDIIDKVGALNTLRQDYDQHQHGSGFAMGITTKTNTPDNN